MDMKTPYAFGKTVGMTYAETAIRVREALAREGFGIISEIEMKEKFAE
jgi:uncharacterized protein (DUF302 family)